MRSPRGLARAGVGILISVVALFLVIRSVDVPAAWNVLKSADPRWVAVLVVFVCSDVLLRALRWRALLAPVAAVPYGTTLASNLVGYLANNILPARLGELVRAHDLGERTGISRSTILGTIVVERVVDTVVVVAIAAIAILALSVRGIVASAILVSLAVSVLLVVAIVVGIAAHRLPGAQRAATYLDRWPRVREVLSRLRDGLSIAKDGRTMLVAVLLTITAWGCTVLAFAAAAQAVGVQPTIGQAALLSAGTNLSTAIPSAPGYVGTYELAAVTIAGSIGISRVSALAFAVLVHVTALLITSIGGAIAFAQGQRARGRRRTLAALASVAEVAVEEEEVDEATSTAARPVPTGGPVGRSATTTSVDEAARPERA
jgi:glycosyltransferase 2 family protein